MTYFLTALDTFRPSCCQVHPPSPSPLNRQIKISRFHLRVVNLQQICIHVYKTHHPSCVCLSLPIILHNYFSYFKRAFFIILFWGVKLIGPIVIRHQSFLKAIPPPNTELLKDKRISKAQQIALVPSLLSPQLTGRPAEKRHEILGDWNASRRWRNSGKHH